MLPFCDHLLHTEEILSLSPQSIPTDTIINNKSVVEAINSTKVTNNKQLNITISVTKQSLQRNEIRSTRWCPSSLQLVNSLTRCQAQSHLLVDTIQSAHLNLEGWILTLYFIAIHHL